MFVLKWVLKHLRVFILVAGGIVGSDFHSFLYTNKNISLLSTNAQAFSRHKSEVCQNVRLLVILCKTHNQTHNHCITDSREKKRVTRKKCKMGDRVQTVYRIEGQMQKELRWQRKRIKGG